MTYYEILQVSPNASKEVIEMAFKALAKQHHPDLNPPEKRQQCEENMKILNNARDILADDDLRRQYDLELGNCNNNLQVTNEEENSYQEYIILPRPWVRYFARMIDLYIGAILIVSIWSSLAPTSYNKVFGDLGNYLSIAIVYIVWLVIESIFVSKLGTTPGKWIFDSKVVSIDGGTLSFSTSLKRSFSVFLNGMGLLIPLVNIFMLVASYNKLKNSIHMSFTTWDIQCRSVVITDKLKPAKIIVSILIFLSIMTGLTYYSNVENEAIIQKNAITQQVNDEKAALEKEEQSLIEWKKDLEAKYEDIIELENKMKEWTASGNVNEYNSNLDEYSNMINNYTIDYEEFESRRLKYNADAESYNKKYNDATIN